MASLRLIDRSGTESFYTLDNDHCLVGRHKSCQINFGSEGQDVSRKHACFKRVGDLWFVEDMGSRNHTYVNGVNIHGAKKRRLVHGDLVSICGYELIFQEETHPLEDSSSVKIHDDAPAKSIDPLSSVSLSSDSTSGISAKLSVLMQIATSLQSTLSLDRVLSQTLDSLFQIFPSAERGVIGFWENDDFHPKWWKLRQTESAGPIKVSKTIVRQVVQRQEAILVDNAISQFPNHESLHSLPFVSVMCAPMTDVNGQVFGVLQIDAAAERGFSSVDLELMATVAIQASFAINYVRLHEETLTQKAIARDLELARDVQREFLPSSPPKVQAYEFADCYEPARFIGGDYFDYVTLDNGCVVIVLADVVGKGAPAALYMARMAMESRACIKQFEGPSVILSELNRRLSMRFATFVICLLNPVNHLVTVANAGHRPPICRRANGTLQSLGESISGYPFSVQVDSKFEETSYELAPGDSVSLFSDGFEDAHNEATDEYFGIDRIRSSIQQSVGGANQIVEDLVCRTKSFSAGTMQLDDMCILTFERVK